MIISKRVIKLFVFYLSMAFILLLTGCNAYYNAFYSDPKKCFLVACEKKPYDVIIIPGFPSDSGMVNGIIEERLNWAYFLYKNGYTKNIIFSGSAVYSPYNEAKVMRLYALQLGINPSDIFLEPKAEHTTENLYYGSLLADKMGFKKVAFATQPAQASFMKAFNRKFKLKVDMLPVVTDSIKHFKFKFDSLNISKLYLKDFVSIEKREGFFTRLNGTRGQHVKKEIRKARRLKRKLK